MLSALGDKVKGKKNKKHKLRVNSPGEKWPAGSDL